MRTAARHLSVAVLVVSLMLSACGCTFYLLPGEGPVPRSAYADRLVGISPAQAAQLQSEAQSSHGFIGELPMAIRGTEDLEGAVLHQSKTFEWPILAGPFGRWWYLDPGAAGGSAGRALVGHDWGWGVLAPVLVGWGHERAYDQETGLCVASEDIAVAALGLAVFHRATSPARKWLVFRDPARPALGPAVAPDVRGGPGGVEYRHAQALALGWGFFALGTKDQRAYVQIAWIPIPLWRTP
jgi:hypothetical protein